MLVLIGPLDESEDCRRMRSMIYDSGVADRIIVTGMISEADLNLYLMNATTLVLPRPISIIAEFNFPTKLPEYLVTGCPVLATRVGDIPHYLKDGDNAYLAEPDDIGGFAAKLDYILGHPVESREVGQRGKKLAEEHFSGRVQARRLISFFNMLMGERLSDEAKA